MSVQADQGRGESLSANQDAGSQIRKVAALDLGSNSFHLVIARIVAHDVQILHQMKLRVQLAEGLDKDNRLSKAAIQRGLESLRYMVESLSDFEPDQVRMVATYTLRKARNAADFVKAAEKILPYPVEIVSGIEEARLIYLGVAHTNHHEGKRLVIDIGGGSTELVVGEGFEPQVLRSLPMGCVTFSNRFFEDRRLRQKDFNKAIRSARQEVEAVTNALTQASWSHCVGSSGTIKTVIDIVHNLGTTSRPGTVGLGDLRDLIGRCVAAGHSSHLDFSGMSEQRRHVLAAGLSILTALFESLEIETLEYSAGALREGVIYEMEDRLSDIDIRDRTAQSLVTRYVVDLAQARRVEATTLKLYDQASEAWGLDKKGLRDLLSWAALLHEVGLNINSKDVHTHSRYIVKSVEMPGFNQEEQQLLAAIIGCHKKRIRPDAINEFLHYRPREVARLIALLRLGVLLNFKRQDGILPDFEVTARKNSLKLTFESGWLQSRPVMTDNLAREENQISVLGIELSTQ